MMRGMAAVLMIGMLGAGIELLFLGHYESPTQFVPLILLAAGVVGVTWHAWSPNRSSLRALRLTMIGFVAGGLLGIALHYRASAEFQKETDSSIRGLTLFMKVMQSKAPPPLAPGAMAYLGLMGLVYTYLNLPGRGKT